MNIFRYTFKSFLTELLLIIVTILFCVPLYLIITISLKTTAGAYKDPLAIPIPPNWASFVDALTRAFPGTPNLLVGILNSAIVAVGVVLLVLLFGSIAAYAIARRTSRLSGFVYIMFLLGIILPAEAGLVPLYAAMRALHLADTQVGLILLYTGFLMPLGVFLYTGFIRQLPRDYEEAAAIDGANRLQVFYLVVFPLLRPITGTVAILTFLFTWNDFFPQLVFTFGTPAQTVPVGLYSLVTQQLTPYNIVFAGVAIAVAPIVLLFLFTNRTMIKGFASGVKG